jgi:hypothetical protein
MTDEPDHYFPPLYLWALGAACWLPILALVLFLLWS